MGESRAAGNPAEAILLAEHALAGLHEAEVEGRLIAERVDSLRFELEAQHLAACGELAPEPEHLAERIAYWKLDSELRTFAAAPDSYAAVLGRAGLARYDEIARAPWRAQSPAAQAMPPRAPGEPFELARELGLPDAARPGPN